MEKEKEMIRFNVRLTPEMHSWFADKSKKTGISMTSLIYLALEQHIQQQNIMPMLPMLLNVAQSMDSPVPQNQHLNGDDRP